MTVMLNVRRGRLGSHEELQASLAELEPEISWLEPAVHLPAGGQRGPFSGFQPIVEGPPPLSWCGMPVDDLRLSWREGLLHIRPEGSAYRWVLFEISPGATRARMRSDVDATLNVDEDDQRPAIWRTDLPRFLGRGSGSEMSNAIEFSADIRAFRLGAAILTWWLVLSPPSDNNRA